MSSVSPINQSDYSQINSTFFPVAPMDTLPAGLGKVNAVKGGVDNGEGEKQNPDLGEYYRNVIPQEYSAGIGSDLINSANNAENIMASAIENGYTVQDACNIRLANMAYKANARVFESTFEFEI